MRPSRKRMPTKLCVMVEARSDQPGVPACLKCCPSCCSNSSCKVLVSSADVHGRRHLVDPISSTLCLRFGPHLRLKAPHHPLGLNLYSGNGCLCGNRIQTSTHFYKCVCVCVATCTKILGHEDIRRRLLLEVLEAFGQGTAHFPNFCGCGQSVGPDPHAREARVNLLATFTVGVGKSLHPGEAPHQNPGLLRITMCCKDRFFDGF